MSSGPEAGGWMTVAVTLLGSLIVWLHKHYEDRKRKRDMAAVPASKLPPPGPEADAAILARLRALEAQQEWASAMDDIERQLAQVRAENANLEARLRVSEASGQIARNLLAGKDAAIRKLRDELARERVRRRGGAVEVAAEHEHRDASQAGPLSDGLPTPIRPPKG